MKQLIRELVRGFERALKPAKGRKQVRVHAGGRACGEQMGKHAEGVASEQLYLVDGLAAYKRSQRVHHTREQACVSIPALPRSFADQLE